MMTVEERARRAVATMIDRRDLAAVDVIAEILRDQVEDCAKVADDEVMRLDRLSIEHKRKGDLDTATRFSACTVTAARLGREIRALAAPGEDKQEKGD